MQSITRGKPDPQAVANKLGIYSQNLLDVPCSWLERYPSPEGWNWMPNVVAKFDLSGLEHQESTFGQRFWR